MRAVSRGVAVAVIVIATLFLTIAAEAQSGSRDGWIKPGTVWLDDRGQPIQAHGGGILYWYKTYYCLARTGRRRTILRSDMWPATRRRT